MTNETEETRRLDSLATRWLSFPRNFLALDDVQLEEADESQKDFQEHPAAR
jgi:hypothetical protein